MPASLVVQTSFIGDVILTTPLITVLAQQGPVDVVTTPMGATVLANNPDVRTVIVYDKRGQDRGVRGFVATARRARRPHGTNRGGGTAQSGVIPERAPHPRCAYLAQGSTRSAALALAAGYTRRVGFSTSAGQWLYTQQIVYRDDWHHARRLLSLADHALAERVDGTMIQPRLYPGAHDVAAVDTLMRGRERPIVAVAPGSVWETKRWPFYVDLCRQLVLQYDVVIVGGAGDAMGMGELLDDVRVIDATGQLSLLGSAEIIRRARVIVTNDSSPQHLASAMGTPTVTVFGPTVPEFGFGPLAPESHVVGRDGLVCRPCDRHGPRRCPLGHWRCMREVSVDTVYGAVSNVLQREVGR